ncbi:MAG: hypothetical protein Q8T09_23555 [Candidatus Melainabacteria bacterium]|nr:hypothetical protein [Candidatus Melainabacteria bacterium]
MPLLGEVIREPGQAAPAEYKNVDDKPMASDLAMVVLLAAGSLSLLTLLISLRWWLGHPMLIYCDQGLYVHMAQLLLDGKVPYIDMFDVNPPLAIYIQILPVVLSRLFHVPAPLSFSIYVSAVEILSCLLMLWILPASRRTGAVVLGACAMIGFAYFNQVQRLDFGQREHIFCIVYAPFLLLRYLRWQGIEVGRWPCIAAGVLAGIGLALKPHFMLMACAPELVWWLRCRQFKPLIATEVRAAVAVIAIYLVHFLFLPPQELKAFFNFVVPIYKEGYEYYVTSPIFNMASFWRVDFLLLALAALLAVVFAPSSSLPLALCAFSFMSAVVFVLAGQDWSCHMIAVRMGNTMALAVEAALLYQLLPLKAIRWGRPELELTGMAASVVALTVVGGGMYLNSVQTVEEEELRNRQPYPLVQVGYPEWGMGTADDMDWFVSTCLEHSSKGDSLIFICASMAPGYPVLLQTERKAGSRFLHGMMLPILSFIVDKPDLDAKAKERFKGYKKQVIDWYTEDIEKNRPKLIFIQDNPMSWVLGDADFINTRMPNYKVVERKGGISVYKRKD